MADLLPFQPTADVAEFADIIIDSAVLMVDGTELTLSRGGWTFDPGEEWEDYAFPGKTMATVGARSLVRLKPVIKGTAMLSGEDQISAFRPDGTWANHASIAGGRTFTPNALRAYLTESDYLENVVCLWKRIRGDFIAVEFPFAVCGSWGIGSTDNDEGLFQIVIEAVQDNDATGTTRTRLPYRVRTVPTSDDASEPEPPPPPDTLKFEFRAELVTGVSSGSRFTPWDNNVIGGDDADARYTSNPPDAATYGPKYVATGLPNGSPAVDFDTIGRHFEFNHHLTTGDITEYVAAQFIQGNGYGALNNAEWWLNGSVLDGKQAALGGKHGITLRIDGKITCGWGATSAVTAGSYIDSDAHVICFQRNATTGAFALYDETNAVIASGAGVAGAVIGDYLMLGMAYVTLENVGCRVKYGAVIGYEDLHDASERLAILSALKAQYVD